jgi:hypothetical protein
MPPGLEFLVLLDHVGDSPWPAIRAWDDPPDSPLAALRGWLPGNEEAIFLCRCLAKRLLQSAFQLLRLSCKSRLA